MPEILATTRPTAEGGMLWRVSYSSSYYDSDERMPGTVAAWAVAFVLAGSVEEAKRKAEPFFKQARKDAEDVERVDAEIVTIESLIAAEEIPPRGGGWFRTEKLRQIALSDPDDATRYRIGVCLIPIEETP